MNIQNQELSSTSKLVANVKSFLNKAENDPDEVHLIFLNREGEVEMCSQERLDDEEDTWSALQEEVRARSMPSFEIFSTDGNTIIEHGEEHLAGVDDDTIMAAVVNALSERREFFEEAKEAAAGA
jgi:hypothetical protein